MNPKIISLSLTKNINKFIALNTLILIMTFIALLFIAGHEKKEMVILISTVIFGILGINLLIAQLMKQKMEKLINHSFEKVESQLYFDELTKVYNRTTGINRLIEEMARAKRTGKPLSVAILDIDNFKQINDKYGHLVGDRVLNFVATQIKNSLRSFDIVARYGGEEFLIILLEIDEINALKVLERVREHIAKKTVKIGHERINITVSIGVTEVINDEDYTSSIERADIALYQVKRSGKNRVDLFLKYATVKN